MNKKLGSNERYLSRRGAALLIPLLLWATHVMAAILGPVRTQAGWVSGTAGHWDPAITVFRGIPYASPPTGKLRWRAPQPPIPWRGVRKADRVGSICPQTLGRPGDARARFGGSEDCLFLNVWTGAGASRERRPVLVWIYGGRFMGGAGSDPNFDGEGLAHKGVVVVTFNYRTGVFGFLATPELSRESGHNASGDYGLLDQIAALEWVHRNIAAFGGDPGRVTIAGQSAGAGSVMLLCDSPLAKGLFRAAIAESGARFPNDPSIADLATSWRTKSAAEREGVEYEEAHGAHSVKQLRALPWQALLRGSDLTDLGAAGGYQDMPRPPIFRPVVDGWVVPYGYSRTWERGSQAHVVLVTGNNFDEGGALPHPKVTLQAYRDSAETQFGSMAGEFLKLYPAASDEQAGQARNMAYRDWARMSIYLFALSWTKAVKLPVYLYDWEHAPPGPRGKAWGAFHGSEINYVFDNLYAADLPWTATDRRIAEIMSDYWTNIAAHGDPNGRGLPRWSAYRYDSRTVMALGDRFGPIAVTDEARFRFWKQFFLSHSAW